MEKPLDRITEAYYNKMGEEFGKKTRERIHWICSQVKGENILDVGCSQGITSILLGREGKRVLGIDLIEESIDFAKKELEKESEITKKYVDFQVANFMDYDFKDKKFDSIIMAEILEHLTDPERFIQKAYKLLNDNGQVIVTVPFGINDYIDHKKTYYLVNLIEEVEQYLNIVDIHFFGKWLGVVTKKKTFHQYEFEISKEIVLKLEENFQKIEEELIYNKLTINNKYNKLCKQFTNTEKELKSEIQQLKEKIEVKEHEIEKLKSKITFSTENFDALLEENKNLLIQNENLKNKTSDLEDRIEKLKIRNSKLVKISKKLLNQNGKYENDKLEFQKKYQVQVETTSMLKKDMNQIFGNIKDIENGLQQENSKLKVKLKKEEENNFKLKQELLEHIEYEEKILVKYKSLLASTNKINKRIKELERKYKVLRESKLGRLTLFYWKTRKKLMDK